MIQQGSVRTAIQEMGGSKERYRERLENRATGACGTGGAGEGEYRLSQRTTLDKGRG